MAGTVRRERPLVDEIAAREVLDLVGCRDAAQHRIAMRMPAETRDHVTVRACLRRGMLEHRSLRHRRRTSQFLGQPYGLIEIAQVLGMTERQKEEGLFPRRVERRVVACVEAGACQRARLRVERIHSRIATVDGSGELVEHDDQCEPRAWILGPAVQHPAAGALVERPEPLIDHGIRATAKPPLELTRHGGRIVRRDGRKPETEHVIGVIHEVGLRATSAHGAGSAGFSTIRITATTGASRAIIPQTFHERVAAS